MRLSQSVIVIAGSFFGNANRTTKFGRTSGKKEKALFHFVSETGLLRSQQKRK